jgi:transcriptional regulator with XRE-family HTH domain
VRVTVASVGRSETLLPALLRYWRRRRGLSQLDLAVAASVSTRHVSFLETGRAQPSREMVLRLGATLGLSMRNQNEMLEAAGFPEQFACTGSGATALPPGIEQAVERMMAQQEPYPMTVLDRRYDVLRANAAANRLFPRFLADPTALSGPLNVLALLFDPRLLRPFVVGWEQVAHAVVARLHRESLARPEDSDLRDVLDRVLAQPGVPERWRHPDFEVVSEPTLVFRVRRDDEELAFLTTLTVFNAPQNVTMEELRIESYFPLDDRTAALCQRLAAD